MKTLVLCCTGLAFAVLCGSYSLADDKAAAKKAPAAAKVSSMEDKSEPTGFFGNDNYSKTAASRALKARPVDRDSFMSLHPRAYDHSSQPYTLNPYKKPSASYYRVSPFDNANSYFKGPAGF